VSAIEPSASDRRAFGVCLSLSFAATIVVLAVFSVALTFGFPRPGNRQLVFSLLAFLAMIGLVRWRIHHHKMRWWLCVSVVAGAVWSSWSYWNLGGFIGDSFALLFNLDGGPLKEDCSSWYVVAVVSPMVVWLFTGLFAVYYWLSSIQAFMFCVGRLER
jgi:hypothetical protein